MHGLQWPFRVASLFVVGLLTVLSTVAAGSPTTTNASSGMPEPAAPADSQTLSALVTAKLLERSNDLRAFADAEVQDTRTSITRRDGRWAFGNAILLAPPVDDAYPEGWSFLARRSGGEWRVAFEGEPLFSQLSQTARVLSPREKKLFASQQRASAQRANGDYRTGMQLPFEERQAWDLFGGPHGWAGDDRPFNSLDFRGGDEVVRAARGGLAYRRCDGWIIVEHNNGYRTDYYHLENEILTPDGPTWVAIGDRLGDTGTDTTPCDGRAEQRHVHFSLYENGEGVAIANHIIGKWIPREGADPYDGYALHGSRRADTHVGDRMYNYGRLGPTEGIVDTNINPDAERKTRTGPGSNYAVAGSVRDGKTVTVLCSLNGTTHEGRWGSTRLWNKLEDGTWLSDAYLQTGVDGPVNGWC